MIMIRLVTLCHQRYCYTVTDYIPHTIHFKLCHLFCTWMFVPLNLRHLLLPLLPHKHTVTTLHFYSPPPAFTVFDNIFYIFLFCVSPNYLSRTDNSILPSMGDLLIYVSSSNFGFVLFVSW